MVKTLIATAVLATALPAQAQLSVDSLTTTASTTVPWANNSTLARWRLFNFLGTALTTCGGNTSAQQRVLEHGTGGSFAGVGNWAPLISFGSRRRG